MRTVTRDYYLLVIVLKTLSRTAFAVRCCASNMSCNKLTSDLSTGSGIDGPLMVPTSRALQRTSRLTSISYRLLARWSAAAHAGKMLSVEQKRWGFWLIGVHAWAA